MKTVLSIVILVITMSCSSLYAQDWAKVNPEMNNILVDTTLLRATVAVIEPGAKSIVHSHPAGFFYALTDCNLKVYYADGETVSFSLKAGEYMYGDPEKPHETENTGTKTAKFLMVELKEHPFTGK